MGVGSCPGKLGDVRVAVLPLTKTVYSISNSFFTIQEKKISFYVSEGETDM